MEGTVTFFILLILSQSCHHFAGHHVIHVNILLSTFPDDYRYLPFNYILHPSPYTPRRNLLSVPRPFLCCPIYLRNHTVAFSNNTLCLGKMSDLLLIFSKTKLSNLTKIHQWVSNMTSNTMYKYVYVFCVQQ